MQKPNISFIGGGKMARAILVGLLNSGFTPDNLNATAPSMSTRQNLYNDLSIKTYATINIESTKVDLIILAVKPQVIKTVCNELSLVFKKQPETYKQPIVVSIAAGITTHAIAKELNSATDFSSPIIRAMPNTPSQIGLGASGLFSAQTLDSSTKKYINEIFASIGSSVWVENEAQLNTVTALSGSGPAYFFKLCEALIAAGVAEGLSHEQSLQLVLQTALGSAQMAKNLLDPNSADYEYELSLSSLRENVTSKGGTTEAGLNSLDKNQFSSIIQHAVQAAKKRSIELSQEQSD